MTSASHPDLQQAPPHQTPPRRAVLVGCGDVGTRIGRRLIDQGWAVTGWRRRPDQLPDAFSRASVDLTRGESVPSLPPDTAAVVFAPSAGSRDPARYESVYHQGLGVVLDRLSESGADHVRVLLVSSTSVHGDAQGVLDESAELTPASPTGEILAQTEGLLKDWRRCAPDGSERSHSAVLRLSGIYGPSRGRLLDRIRAGELGDGVTEDPAAPWRISNRIHADDAARAAVRMIEADSTPGVVLGVDHLPVPVGAVHNWLARRLERPLPWADPRLAPQSADTDWVDGPWGRRPDDSPAHGKAFDGSRLHRLLGELIHRDFRSGYAEQLSPPSP